MFFGLLEIFFIWGIILLVVRKRRGSVSGKRGGQAPNTTVTTAGTNSSQNNGRMMQNRNPQNGQWMQNMPPHGGPGMQGAPGGRSIRNDQRTPVPAPASNTVPNGGEEESTTAYLAKKAEEDAREHAREKWEEEKRLREAKGGLIVAQRYLDGDPVPNGQRCVACGYCGAENLVPMMPRTRYSCYFCREPLN